MIQRLNKRVEANDAQAIYTTGCYYWDGTNGFEQDYTKALELYHRAAELGYVNAYHSIGCAYEHGDGGGVEVDMKKSQHYTELAAIRGEVIARWNLGNREGSAGNADRAMKHFIIAVRGGSDESLKMIKDLYSNGFAGKEDYMKALQSYQAYLDEIKSDQRDKAAAADEKYEISLLLVDGKTWKQLESTIH